MDQKLCKGGEAVPPYRKLGCICFFVPSVLTSLVMSWSFTISVLQKLYAVFGFRFFHGETPPWHFIGATLSPSENPGVPVAKILSSSKLFTSWYCRTKCSVSGCYWFIQNIYSNCSKSIHRYFFNCTGTWTSMFGTRQLKAQTLLLLFK